MRIDPIELSRELIAFNTVNPPGNELSCIQHLEKILTCAGLETSLQNFAPDRANLIARIGGVGSKRPLCFTGHVDTVPLGNSPWSVDPFAGEIRNGKIYGRGSTDMKCGVAAFVAAIGNMTEQLEGTSGAVLVITAGEEIGCEGAFQLARAGVLGQCRRNRSSGAHLKCSAGRTQGRPLAPPDAEGRHRTWIDAASRHQRRL
jgi:succinyl-diaminopimelate desuccinylase